MSQLSADRLHVHYRREAGMSSNSACRHKLYATDLDDKGVPRTYKNGYAEYDDHAIHCINSQAPQSVLAAWKRFHPIIASSETKHRIFDAGCGTGFVIQALVKSNDYNRQNLDIYGGDYSEEMLSMASMKNIYDDLKVVNLKEELPYEPESFDSIVSSGVFLQGHCGPECLLNIIRVLKRGCYFITTVRALFYKETKEEWDRQIQACGAELLEAYDAPYNKHSEGTVLVLQKK